MRPVCTLFAAAITATALAQNSPTTTPPTTTPKQPVATPSATRPRTTPQQVPGRQPQVPPQPAATDKPAAGPDDPVFFRDEPLTIEGIGLSLLVPDGAEVVADSMAGNTAATFQDSDRHWVIKVQTPRTANKELALTKLVDDGLQQLLDSTRILEIKPGAEADKGIVKDASKVEARVIAREPAAGQTLTISNDGNAMPIERFYVELPPLKGQDPVVRGFTAARIGQDQFITFELFTTKSQFDRARKVYELTVGGARFADMTKAKEQRATMVTAGVKFMGSVTRDDIDSLVKEQPERWERLYRPSKTGKRIDDTEVGYRRVRLSTGREAGANREGWIVRIDARFMQANSIVDSQSFFHMTYDREEENWSVRMTIKNPAPANGKQANNPPETHSETGARFKDQMQVRVESPGAAPKTIRPQIAGDGYVSRVESFLLPQLLVRKGIPLTYGFYAYQSQSERITLRKDTLERPKTANGSWKLMTRLAEGMPETTSYYNTVGVVTQGDMGSGIVCEPTSAKDLLDLWKSKGLPLD